MPDEIRINRPSAPAAQTPPAYSGQAAASQPGSSSKLPWVILAVVVVVLVVLGFLFRDKLFGGSQTVSTAAPKLSGYQAVFLTNGQVYFGKIASQDDSTVTLKDIYYLQVVQPPLQGQQTGQQAQNTQQQQPQISLVKLGSELHGPADEMHIYKNQVLFYEDLKADGKVAQAIASYKATPQSDQTQQQAPSQTPAAQPAPTVPPAK